MKLQIVELEGQKGNFICFSARNTRKPLNCIIEKDNEKLGYKGQFGNFAQTVLKTLRINILH